MWMPKALLFFPVLMSIIVSTESLKFSILQTQSDAVGPMSATQGSFPEDSNKAYYLRSTDLRSSVQTIDLDTASLTYATPDSTLYVNEGSHIPTLSRFSLSTLPGKMPLPALLILLISLIQSFSYFLFLGFIHSNFFGKHIDNIVFLPF